MSRLQRRGISSCTSWALKRWALPSTWSYKPKALRIDLISTSTFQIYRALCSAPGAQSNTSLLETSMNSGGLTGGMRPTVMSSIRSWRLFKSCSQSMEWQYCLTWSTVMKKLSWSFNRQIIRHLEQPWSRDSQTAVPWSLRGEQSNRLPSPSTKCIRKESSTVVSALSKS